MFAKFSDTVRKESTDKIPKEVLAAYNQQIPENMRAQYVDKHNGTCELVPIIDDSNTQITFTVPSAKLIDKVPDDIKNQEDLVDYMYRTQKVLHYRVDGNPYMIINGFKVNFEDIIKSPYGDFKLQNGGTLYLAPQKFPELKPLSLVVGDTTLKLNVKRIPDERKDVIVLQTDENFWLQIIMELSTVNGGQSTIRILCRFQSCKTVRDLLSAYKVSDELACGNYSMPFMETAIPLPLKNPIPQDIREFWEKALQVENVLKIQFDPTAVFYRRDMNLIQQLYQGLVLNRPFSSFVNEGPQTGLHSGEKEGFEKNIGQPMAIAFVENHQWNVLGVSFETCDLCCIFDAIISDVTEDSKDSDKPYFVHLVSVEDKKMRLVRYIAKSESEILDFQAPFESNNELLKYLSEAKAISK